MPVIERSSLECGVGAGHEAARLAAALGPSSSGVAARSGLCDADVVTVRSLSSVACLTAALLAGCGGDSGGYDSKGTPSTPAKPTKVRGGGYSFTAPPGWAQRRVRGLDAALERRESAPQYPASVTVVVAPAPKGVTVEQAAPIFRQGVTKQGARKIVDLPAMKVDGERAVALRYERRAGAVTLSQEVVSVIRKRRTYAIGLTAPPGRFSAAERDFRRMLRSWRWR